MSSLKKNLTDFLSPDQVTGRERINETQVPQNKTLGHSSTASDDSSIKRRNFLGCTLSALAGLAVSPIGASAAESGSANALFGEGLKEEQSYWDRTDRFEEKLELLESAWGNGDYRLARSLCDSLRISGIQAQVDQQDPEAPVSASSDFGQVSSLPPEWREWAKGWKYFKVIKAESVSQIKRKISPEAEMLGYPVNYIPSPEFRSQEPIDLCIGFKVDQVISLKREIRVARLTDGLLNEITSQVYNEIRRGDEWFCNLMFLADSHAASGQTFLVFYSNPDAELPAYMSDLETNGDGFELDIENDFFKVKLSRQTGQIESIVLKRERGLELYSGGEGHGEPAGIDWAHDYVAQGHFQKLRTTLWGECPDFEVIRGPICTIVRRWGFPYSPIHPIFSPSRINMDIEYRFYSGLPYFQKSSKMTTLKELIVDNLRDEEWVITGQAFTEMLWVDSDGKVNLGEVDPKSKDNLWGVGLYNRDTMDSFIGLFLEHRAEGLSDLHHSGAPSLFNKWHGQLWSRHALQKNTRMPAGTVLHQKNAYLLIPFTEADGPAIIEDLRNELIDPLRISASTLKESGAKISRVRLARTGESGDSPIPKALLWEALGRAKDGQLLAGVASVVELGFIYDIVVKGGLVKVVIAMPHRGRPLGIYFQHGSNAHESYHGSMNIPETLLKVPGVEKVIMEQTWYPAWTSNLITDEGRKKLKLF